MKLSISVAPLLLLSISSFQCFASATEQSIVGTWEFTEAGCTDRYEFRQNGEFSSTSSKETLEGTFVADLVAPGEPAGIKVVRSIVVDNLGKDCTGSTRNDAGRSDTRYVKISEGGKAMMVCATASALRCFGPLKRVEE